MAECEKDPFDQDSELSIQSSVLSFYDCKNLIVDLIDGLSEASVEIVHKESIY